MGSNLASVGSVDIYRLSEAVPMRPFFRAKNKWRTLEDARHQREKHAR